MKTGCFAYYAWFRGITLSYRDAYPRQWTTGEEVLRSGGIRGVGHSRGIRC